MSASATGLQLQVINADSEREYDDAFESFAREQPDALFVGPGPFFLLAKVPIWPSWHTTMRCRQPTR